MKQNLIANKSYSFAKDIVNLYKTLSTDKKEFVLSKQLLKSGTSICANVQEALGAQSKKDFIAKMHISYKETKETIYWLTLLRDTDYLNINAENNILPKAEELLRIINKIIQTSKSNL